MRVVCECIWKNSQEKKEQELGEGIRICCFNGFVDFFNDGIEEETPATDAEHEAAAATEDQY